MKKAASRLSKKTLLKGRAYKFGNNISTDLIISGRYKFSIRKMPDLAEHLLEDAERAFYQRIKDRPTFIVAGWNFGLGSSREQAPWAIKEAGILAVIAKNFARIFLRNAYNIGLPLIECDTDLIAHGDALELDLKKDSLINKSKQIDIPIKPLDPVIKELLKADGLVEYFKKHKGLNFAA